MFSFPRSSKLFLDDIHLMDITHLKETVWRAGTAEDAEQNFHSGQN